ncbi:helix-turn-helix domain-containing protein [Starkeya koreensis]|uniref:Helix-turn-helix domain-containing protein n=1 Tax=Ancylobacter koreensis TaxID=266121 RepID=A0ABT0DHR9_9HYPH|nr:helix-turn-helix domain-containing protein [Ancylobacter koreensis]MCK0206841.1 helix-turn-helix domain-containing protein [Ancylobacter koreensis]
MHQLRREPAPPSPAIKTGSIRARALDTIPDRGRYRPPIVPPERPAARLFGGKLRGARRLVELAQLARLRRRLGAPLHAGAALSVASDALWVLDGAGWLDANVDHLSRQLPPGIEAEEPYIAAVLNARSGRRNRLSFSPGVAGDLLDFTAEERDLLAADGFAFVTLTPCDESAEDRLTRRAERRREANGRQSANVTSKAGSLFKNKAASENVTNSGRLLDAIAAGLSSAHDIAERLGMSSAAARQALKRLVDAGLVRRIGRGRYAPVSREGEP